MPVLYHVLCRKMRKARLNAGYTQEETAELLGMSLLHYGRLERGQRKPSLEQIGRISKVIGCPVSELLRGCFPEETEMAFAEREPSAFVGKMMAIMEGCTEEELELLYEIMRLIAYRKAMQK